MSFDVLPSDEQLILLRGSKVQLPITLLWAVFYSKFLPQGINKTGPYELFNINEIWILGAKCQNLGIDIQIYDNNIHVCEIWVQTPQHIYPKSIVFYDRKNSSQYI